MFSTYFYQRKDEYHLNKSEVYLVVAEIEASSICLFSKSFSLEQLTIEIKTIREGVK